MERGPGEDLMTSAHLIVSAVQMKTRADQEKMGAALSRLAQEDATFKVRTDMVDIRVSLYDGSHHDVDSNEMAFKEAARKAQPVLLEPVMAVEIAGSEDWMGTIIGDLNARRGRIESMEMVTAPSRSRPRCRC